MSGKKIPGELVFGAMARPLIEQIPSLAGGVAAIFQRDADAITRLSARGLLTQAEKSRAYSRLTRRIVKDIDHG